MQDRVVGRDATLVLALAALESTGRVIVEGPAGIGKTALLRALVEAAAASGQLVLRCAPTESEAALPLAAFADLVAPLVDDLAALSEPQQRAVRSALLLGSEDGAVDERTLASATLALLESAADRTPAGVLVVVDDALWLDQPSERALRFALRRTSARVRVVVSSRSDGADTPLGMDDRAEHVRLAPLGVGPLHHLLTERFGISLSRPVVARVAQESGGNPLLAIELTRALLRLPRMPGPGADFPVPASMHDVVAASLAMLPPEGVRAVRLAALLSAPTLADLTAAGVPGDALDAAEEVGLVVVEDVGRVRFTHPVHASAVRAGVPAGVRRRLHEQLAAASTDPDERARHLARCTTEPSSQVATELGLAARRARSRGAPDAAAELYDRAAALCRDDGTAPTVPAPRTELRLRQRQLRRGCRPGGRTRPRPGRRPARRGAAAPGGHRVQRRRPAAGRRDGGAGPRGCTAGVPPGGPDPRSSGVLRRPRGAGPRPCAGGATTPRRGDRRDRRRAAGVRPDAGLPERGAHRPAAAARPAGPGARARGGRPVVARGDGPGDLVEGRRRARTGGGAPGVHARRRGRGRAAAARADGAPGRGGDARRTVRPGVRLGRRRARARGPARLGRRRRTLARGRARCASR